MSTLPPETVERMAEEFEALLQEKATENASLTFSIGCFLSLMLALVTVAVLTLALHWVSGLIAGLLLLLLALSLTAFLSTRAHSQRAETAYHTDIHPRLEAAAAEVGLSAAELSARLRAALPRDALLHSVLEAADEPKVD